MQVDWHSDHRRTGLAVSFANPEAGVGRCRRRGLSLAGLDLKRQKLPGSKKTVPKTLPPSPWDHLGPQSWGYGLRRLCLLQECAVRAQRSLHGKVLEVGKASGRKSEWGESLGDFRWGEGCTGGFREDSWELPAKREFLGTSVGRQGASGDRMLFQPPTPPQGGGWAER